MGGSAAGLSVEEPLGGAGERRPTTGSHTLNTWESGNIRRLVILGLAVAVVLIGGTAGYMAIEGMSLLDSLYQTVITMSTVGFREVQDLSPPARVFTMLVIAAGVSTVFYGLGVMMEFVVSGELTGLYRRRALRKRIEELRDHYIICGFGRVGAAVAQEFEQARAPFVVIDNDPEIVQEVEQAGYAAVLGDAADDDALLIAGILRARGLVAAVDSDAGNTFVTLTARELRPALLIVARANAEESVSKLRRAGANQVISPYLISGKKMATLLLQPLVSDYLDVMTGTGEIEFRLEEFKLNDTCEVVGRSIKELEVRQITGATILAVRHGDGAFDTNPAPGVVLKEDDVLICIGTPLDIARLEELFACRIPPLGNGGLRRET